MGEFWGEGVGACFRGVGFVLVVLYCINILFAYLQYQSVFTPFWDFAG